jgi:FMN phosphatase YigB (HAD superfamily)
VRREGRSPQRCPLLILDAGGVLVTEPIPRLLAALAEESPFSYDELERRYKRNLYFDLWRGRLPEDDFWSALAREADVNGSAARWRSVFLGSLLPLPALLRVPEWADRAAVSILSNHLPQWLEPLLVRAGVKPHLSGLFISARTGHVKPEREAFAHALRAKPDDCKDVLLVDDNAHNLEVARELGMDALLGGEDGDWSAQADDWLHAHGR